MIRGYVESDSPLVDCVVNLPGLRANASLRVTFLIDTGAAISLLHPRDAVRFGIDLASVSSDQRIEPAMTIGGLARFLRTTALLSFEEELPREHPLRHPIGIAEPNGSNVVLPSILGMDFLRHFRLTVSVRDDRAELEPMF